MTVDPWVVTTIGSALAWLYERMDRRSSSRKRIAELEKKLTELEAQIASAAQGAKDAATERAREMELLRDDLERLQKDRDQWMDRSEHLEKIVYGRPSA